jgi:hypothetical protein
MISTLIVLTLIVLVLLVVFAVFFKPALGRSHPERSVNTGGGALGVSAAETVSKSAKVRGITTRIISNHQGMWCYVRGEEHLFLPREVTQDKVVLMPLGLGHGEVARKRTVSLTSINDPRPYELQASAEHLELIHIATNYGLSLNMQYLDDSGREVERDVGPLIAEDETFVTFEKERVRKQWIQSVHLAQDSFRRVASPERLLALLNDSLSSDNSNLRWVAISVAEYLGDNVEFQTLQKLAEDPDGGVRGAVADRMRAFGRRVRKKVRGKSFTFLDPEQDEEVFKILKILTADGCATVRQKAAYALGDHPGMRSVATLDRLLLDPVEEVRKAAAHAKNRLAEQEAIRTEYQAVADAAGAAVKSDLSA